MTDQITRAIPLDTLREWGFPAAFYERDSIVVSMETEDDGRRWMDVTTCVFKAPDDGLHYSFRFDVGKTEHQEQDWDEDFKRSGHVVCTRVEAREITVTQWLPVATAPADTETKPFQPTRWCNSPDGKLLGIDDDQYEAEV